MAKHLSYETNVMGLIVICNYLVIVKCATHSIPYRGASNGR